MEGEKVRAPEMGLSWDPLERWKLVRKWLWRESEHNNILETRTVTSTLKHLVRQRSAWDSKVLIFTDNLCTLGVLSKGRSSVFAFLVLARRAAAMTLAVGIRMHLRWVPSELDYADGPSRGEDVGVAQETQQAHQCRGLSSRLVQSLKIFHGCKKRGRKHQL